MIGVDDIQTFGFQPSLLTADAAGEMEAAIDKARVAAAPG